jgi:hypothetical protein
LTQKSDTERLAGAVGAITQITSKVAATLEANPETCECDKTMAPLIEEYNLSPDFRQWFT